jgi:cobalt-zinc-cadmium efflux system membrane fusion protein
LRRLLVGCAPWLCGALRGTHAPVVAVIMAVAAVAIVLLTHEENGSKKSSADTELSSQSRRGTRFVPTPEQWSNLGIVPVTLEVFRSEHVTEGKISINEDTATPVYSPYPGRVTRLLVKPGDEVKLGQPLFFIEAADMVQAQNDFLAAVAGLNKAKSRLEITEIIERQNRKLYESRAASLRDWQQSQSDVAQAQSELRSAEAALEAARNRLRLLGKGDDEITAFQEKGKISPETPIYAPISGTVVQRKVGPGQYVSYTSIGSVEPVFMIGNLSTVWLVAYIRESEAPKVRVGQALNFTVLAYPKTAFSANIDYVAAALDPNIRRLMVRATIDNSSGQFKPEMFATVIINIEEGDRFLAVPREAVIYEADKARVWVARSDRTIEPRQIKTGETQGNLVQVLEGLRAGESVVTKGSLFIDQAAGS